MKSGLVTACVAVAALSLQTTSRSASQDDFEAARCEAVVVSKPVVFHGRKLEEIPDITEPELRLANQLLSSRCGARAEAIYQRFVRAHPENFHAAYHLARSQWIQNSPDASYRVLQNVLKDHPDFASAKVLLAGLEFSANNFLETRRLLDEAEVRSPTDVWIYINRSRLAAMENPTPPELMTRMFEIARNEALPPNVRTVAIEIGKPLTGASAVDYEEFLRIDASIRSTSEGCQVARLANYLNGEGRFDEVRALLESPQARRDGCRSFDNRLFLAQAYLMQAAAINPTPVRANTALIAKADEILDGDYAAFATWIDGRRQSPKWVPLLPGKLDPDEESEEGFSLLCHAAVMLDTELVRAYLEAGGSPQSQCGGTPIMLLLAMMADGINTTGLQATARVLLEKGAPPPADLCGKVRDPGFCSRDLAPLFLMHLPRR
jgi:hypothetical protein